LNQSDQAGALGAVLDRLRRQYGVCCRVLAHFRRARGVRLSRGSQEIGGSYQLGAWGEASLFFEPVRRTHGAVRIDAQLKDGAAVPSFTLTFEANGPTLAPTSVRLIAEEVTDDTSQDDAVLQALASAPTTAALVGTAGVSVVTLALTLKRSDKTIRRSLKPLVKGKIAVVSGKAAKNAALYRVAGSLGHDTVSKQDEPDEGSAQ